MAGQAEVTYKVRAALSAVTFYQSHHYKIKFNQLWKSRGGIEILMSEMEKSAVQRS